MATHSSTLAWNSPWGREESDMTERLHFHFSLSCIGEGNGNPFQCSCWRIPGTGEPGGLPSMGSHRVGHDRSNLEAAAAAAVFHILVCVCVCVFVNAQKCSCWILWQICLIVYYQSIFQSGCVILYVQYQCASDQISLHSQQHLVLSPFHFW